jgi:hypothetical protein
MRSVAGILDYMSEEGRLPLAGLFVILPTVMLALFYLISSVPLSVFVVVAGLLKDILFWVALSGVMLILLRLLKGAGTFSFAAVLSRMSLIYILKSAMILSFILGFMIIAPALLPALGETAAEGASFYDFSQVVANIDISSAFVVWAVALFWLVIMLVAVIFSLYIIYKTISAYAEAKLATNLLVFVLLLIAMLVFNYFI